MGISIQAIDHLNLFVGDLPRSIRFYACVFGFEVREDHRDDAEPWAILGASGRAYLALYENPVTRTPDHPWFNHWSFVVDDLDAALCHLEANGVEPERYRGRTIIEWPRSRSLYIHDPDGYEIELTSRFGGGLD